MRHLYALLARIALALVFAADGLNRLGAAETGSTTLLATFQLLAALALLAGAGARSAALLLAAWSLIPGLALSGTGAPPQSLELFWSLLLGGGLVLLAAHGPGDFSFDAWRRDRGGRPGNSHMTPGGAL